MNGEELFPFAKVKLIDGGDGLNSGIRDQDIDAPERRDRLRHAIRGGGCIGDIDGDPDRPPGSAKLGGGRLGASLVEVGDHHLGAFARKQRRNSVADAARRAGNDRDFIFKLHPALQFLLQFFGQSLDRFFDQGNRKPPCQDQG